jgi:hypothetical protein
MTPEEKKTLPEMCERIQEEHFGGATKGSSHRAAKTEQWLAPNKR